MKAAFTRAYQKNPPMLPYAINSTATAKKKSMPDNDVIEDDDDDEEETDDINSDKMIKVKNYFREVIVKCINFSKKYNHATYFRQRNLLLLVLAKLHQQKKAVN